MRTIAKSESCRRDFGICFWAAFDENSGVDSGMDSRVVSGMDFREYSDVGSRAILELLLVRIPGLNVALILGWILGLIQT